MSSSHELAKLLLELPDKPIRCSVDLDTEDRDEGRRCFGEFSGEINDVRAEAYTLLFECGELNFKN